MRAFTNSVIALPAPKLAPAVKMARQWLGARLMPVAEKADIQLVVVWNREIGQMNDPARVIGIDVG
jgi:hypothetical protein